jgi:hypothetical protein
MSKTILARKLEKIEPCAVITSSVASLTVSLSPLSEVVELC